MKSKQRPGVVFQPRVHHALQRGINKMVGAVRPTLGPLSCGVAIDHLHKQKALPEFLDNGGLIARRIIELANRDEDMGAMLARSMILRQHEEFGDGTATAAVLFEAIFNAGLRYIAAGGNAMLIRQYLEKLLPVVLKDLEALQFRLEGQDTFAQMALSLCHDEDMARLLGEAFDLVGEYGRVEVREDYGRGVSREYNQGNYFYAGMFSRVLLPPESVTSVTFENPSIFVCDFEVEDHQELFPVLQEAHWAGVKELVIIARNLSEKAISLLVTNNNMDRIRVMAIKLPGLNPTERMGALEDLAALTGARPFIKETGDSLQKAEAKHFGQARRVWADLRKFGIIGGRGNPRQIREHLHRLQQRYHSTSDPDERKRTQERIGNLMGGSVTLWVGGFTETEINARKSQAERTVLALRSAILEGVVPGGGIALLNCRDALEKRLLAAQAQSNLDADERAAYRILIDALAAPARAIYQNAGYDPSEILAQLTHQPPDMGFDVVANRMVRMRDAGILDSALVLKASVKNAIGTASLALTVDSLVHLAAPVIVSKPE